MYYVCSVDYGHDNAKFFFAVHVMSNLESFDWFAGEAWKEWCGGSFGVG